MTDTLPSDVDIVVLGTGLPEAIVAGAAAKAGKRLLHLDSEDYYGSSWASLPLVETLAWASRRGEGATLAVSRLGGLGPTRQYNIDLAPKCVFCADPLIDCLLQARAQHYLEFKLLQGSYVWQQGALMPVPASRKDVFETTLSLADKRSLWRFLKSASEALQGQGPLKDAFDHTPLAQLLSAEGLTKPLREALLYAVAMADADQEASGSDLPQESSSPSKESAARCATAEQPDAQQACVSEGHCNQPAGSMQVAPQASAPWGGSITAAEGKAAFARYLASVGRYGRGTGAFLTPMYGTGELAQAFCRMAAVHGAVYALRQPVPVLHIDEATEECTGIELASGQVISCQAVVSNAEMLQQARRVTAPGGLGQASTSSGAARSQDRVFNQSNGSASSSGICRAVCILDRSLRDNEQHFSIVVPPAAAGNANAVRLTQLGPAVGVSPPDRYLLYASTPSQGASAAATLRPILQPLICLPQQEQPLTPDAVTSLASSKDSSLPASSGMQDNKAEQSADSHSSSAPSSPNGRPQALLALYYHQKTAAEPLQALPNNVQLVQPPDGSVGCVSVVQHAREVFSNLLPGEDMLAGGAATLAGDDSDDDAIEALDSALNRLQQSSDGGH